MPISIIINKTCSINVKLEHCLEPSLSFGQDNLITNREEFIKMLKEESLSNFKLPGTKIGSLQRKVPIGKFNNIKI